MPTFSAGASLHVFRPSGQVGGFNSLDVTAFVQGLPPGSIVGFSLSGAPIQPGPAYTYFAAQSLDESVRPRLVIEVVPEPATALLVATGLLGMACRRRSRVRRIPSIERLAAARLDPSTVGG